jgi:hypothetical protein
MALASGLRIGKYELGRKLGEEGHRDQDRVDADRRREAAGQTGSGGGGHIEVYPE